MLISKSNKNSKFIQHQATKRPNEIACDIHRTTIGGEDWIILVGLLEGKPYEVIGGLSNYIEIPKKYKTGSLIKRPRKTSNSRYDLKFGENGNEVVIKDIVKIFDNPNQGAFTRLISLGLRHGANINYVVEQLRKDKDSDLFSFGKCIARVLKNYIQNGTKVCGNLCPSCNNRNLVYQDGCTTCKDCGWAGCG